MVADHEVWASGAATAANGTVGIRADRTASRRPNRLARTEPPRADRTASGRRNVIRGSVFRPREHRLRLRRTSHPSWREGPRCGGPGSVDEIRVHVVPVLFVGGTPPFGARLGDHPRTHTRAGDPCRDASRISRGRLMPDVFNPKKARIFGPMRKSRANRLLNARQR